MCVGLLLRSTVDRVDPLTMQQHGLQRAWTDCNSTVGKRHTPLHPASHQVSCKLCNYTVSGTSALSIPGIQVEDGQCILADQGTVTIDHRRETRTQRDSWHPGKECCDMQRRSGIPNKTTTLQFHEIAGLCHYACTWC